MKLWHVLFRAVVCGACGVGLVVGLVASATAAEPLVVHEWGTFTTLQNERGTELPGINIDDEPVPPFVHNLGDQVLSQALVTSPAWRYRQKGVPRHHPLVTMRLETPVLYFYPPRNAALPLTVDVSVRFPQGWLSEFYPAATVDAPQARKSDEGLTFDKLDSSTVGQLTWHDLQVGTQGEGPETDWPVWNTPRKVPAAAMVTSREGESERYVFYRGVARLSGPIKVTLNRKLHELSVTSAVDQATLPAATSTLPPLWLVHVRADGRLAFRTLSSPFGSSPDSAPVRGSTQFEDASYSAENLARLKSDMHAALVADGLFADEAAAMLATWNRAYFTSRGLRVFYLVPRAWTDAHLPLTISTPARVERVMIGRTELISDEQDALLARLAKTPVSPADWPEKLPPSEARTNFLAGRSDIHNLGILLPLDYQIYYDLGRFRNALVSHAAHTMPKPHNFDKFIQQYGLQAYDRNQFTQNEPQAGDERDSRIED